MYPKAERAVRAVLRKRAHLVRQQTAHMLSVHNSLLRNTGGRFQAQRMRALGPAARARLLLEPDQGRAVRRGLAVLHTLGPQITTGEKAVSKALTHTPASEHLCTVDGSGTILAQPIVLATGDIGRFPPVGHYAAACRGVPSTKSSNGQRKGPGNVKNGHKYLSGA